VTNKEEIDKLVELCTQSWPRAATDCVLATPDEQGLDACDKLIPRPESHQTDEQRAKKMVLKIAYEAFPVWAVGHPDKSCPASLDELEDVPAKDPWGQPFKLYCGSTKRFGVVSAGPDQKFDTLDDIKSWDLLTNAGVELHHTALPGCRSERPRQHPIDARARSAAADRPRPSSPGRCADPLALRGLIWDRCPARCGVVASRLRPFEPGLSQRRWDGPVDPRAGQPELAPGDGLRYRVQVEEGTITVVT